MDERTIPATNFPSPPVSSAASTNYTSPLPQPRRHPLKPGGTKESELITYLDRCINSVQKRVDNRIISRQTQATSATESGYREFWELEKDVDAVIDVIWVSGSPHLQVPYLLNIAVLLNEYLSLFTISDRSIRSVFRLLSKLDDAFASLLRGRNITSDELLSGFEGGYVVSTTDKVRLKGVVERTRLTVVRVTSGDSVLGDENGEDDPMDISNSSETKRGESDTIVFEGFEDNEDEDEEWEERHIGSVYEKTIGELGDVLGGPPIGIITDD